MKKLALVLSFVFAAAMIAPAFAADPVKKSTESTKATCTKEAAKDCAATCAKAAGDKKEAAACCSKKEATPTAAKAK